MEYGSTPYVGMAWEKWPLHIICTKLSMIKCSSDKSKGKGKGKAVSGAQVLTSGEPLALMEEKERLKQEEDEAKERQKL